MVVWVPKSMADFIFMQWLMFKPKLMKLDINMKENNNADDSFNKVYYFKPIKINLHCQWNDIIHFSYRVNRNFRIIAHWTIRVKRCPDHSHHDTSHHRGLVRSPRYVHCGENLRGKAANAATRIVGKTIPAILILKLKIF